MSRSLEPRRSLHESTRETKVRCLELVGWVIVAVAATGYLYLTGLLGGFREFYLPVLVLAITFLILRLTRVFSRISFPILVIAFVLTMLPGLVDSSYSDYARGKVLGLGIAVLLLFLPSAAIRPQRAIRASLVIATALCSILTVKLLLVGEELSNAQLTVEDLNSIHTGRAVGFAVTMLSIYILAGSREQRRYKLFALVPWAIGVYALAAVGSRGPALSTFLAVVAATGVLLFRRRVSPWITVLVILGGFGASVLLDSYASRLFAGGSSGRDLIYREAWSRLAENPWGTGWGDYSKISTLGYEWPHNIFLEIGIEGGWAPLLTFSCLFFVTLISSTRAAIHGPDATSIAVLGFLVYAITNAQFSADISGNSILWAAMGFALAANRFRPQLDTPNRTEIACAARDMKASSW